MTVNGRDLKVPGWFFGAISVVAVVLAVGWKANGAVRDVTDSITRMESDLRYINARLCRLERAARIEPWPSCPGALSPLAVGTVAQ